MSPALLTWRELPSTLWVFGRGYLDTTIINPDMSLTVRSQSLLQLKSLAGK